MRPLVFSRSDDIALVVSLRTLGGMLVLRHANCTITALLYDLKV